MSGRSGKKFITLGPYQDLPSDHYFTPKGNSLKLAPGRERYYDNLAYVHSPEKRKSRSIDSSHSSYPNKNKMRKSRKTRYCVAAGAIFLLFLAIATAVGVGVFFLHNQMSENNETVERPPPSKVDSALASDPDFQGSVKVTSYTWDPRMADKESDQFRSAAAKMEAQLDNIFNNSAMGPVYDYSVVNSLTQGSVNINFTVHLKKLPEDVSEEQKKDLENKKEELKKTPNIVAQSIKEGVEELKKTGSATATEVPVLEIVPESIEVKVVVTTTTASVTPTTTTPTTTTVTPTTTSATSTTTPTTTQTTPTTTSQTTPSKDQKQTTPTTTSQTTPTKDQQQTTKLTTQQQVSTQTTTTKQQQTTVPAIQQTTTQQPSTTSAAQETTSQQQPSTTTASQKEPSTTSATQETTSQQQLSTTSATQETTSQQQQSTTSAAVKQPTPATTAQQQNATISTTSLSGNGRTTTQETIAYSCSTWSRLQPIINETCNDVIKVINSSDSLENKCIHFASLVKCSVYITNLLKLNCSVDTMMSNYYTNKVQSLLNLDPNQCKELNRPIVSYEPSSDPCTDVEALKYMVTYSCDVSRKEGEGPCSPMQKAAPCINESLSSMGLNCPYINILTTIDLKTDQVFGQERADACNELKEKLINGTCYGMKSPSYISDMSVCMKPLSEIRRMATDHSGICRMFVESSRCLEKRYNSPGTCSGEDISDILLEQILMLVGYGPYGLSAVRAFYGSDEISVQLLYCRDYVKNITSTPRLCEDSKYLNDTIISTYCMGQVNQGRDYCSVTVSDLIECGQEYSRYMGENCTREGIVKAIDYRRDINATLAANDDTSICNRSSLCRGVLVRYDDVLMCLQFMASLDYNYLSLNDTCMLFGEGMKCISRYMAYKGANCPPNSLKADVASHLIRNKYSELDFNQCKGDIPTPSADTLPVCGNEYAMMKYLQSSCLPYVSKQLPPNYSVDMSCGMMSDIADCAVKSLSKAMIYCDKGLIMHHLVNKSDEMVKPLFPQFDFSRCTVPLIISPSTTTQSSKIGAVCTWQDMMTYSDTYCRQLVAEIQNATTDKCSLFEKLGMCIYKNLFEQNITCSLDTIQRLTLQNKEMVILGMNINPEMCLGNRTTSPETGMPCINPFSGDYAQCITPAFLNTSSQSPQCNLYAHALTCVFAKAKQNGVSNCPIMSIHQTLVSFTNLMASQQPSQPSTPTVNPNIPRECDGYVKNVDFTNLPDICEDKKTIGGSILPTCIRPIAQGLADNLNITLSCFVVLPSLQNCVQMYLQSMNIDCTDPTKIISDNMAVIGSTFPTVDFSPCLNNGSITSICPTLSSSNPGVSNPLNNAYVCLSMLFTGAMSPISQDEACSLYGSSVKCVMIKSKMMGYSCSDRSIHPVVVGAFQAVSSSLKSNLSISDCAGQVESVPPICDDDVTIGLLATTMPCNIYIQSASLLPGGICGSLLECVAQKLSSSGMYCNRTSIVTALMKQLPRLKQAGVNFNASECPQDSKPPVLPGKVLESCAAVLQAEQDPRVMCKDSLIALNRTQDQQQRCSVFYDAIKCLVFSTYYMDYNCTAEDLLKLYRANSSLLDSYVSNFNPATCDPPANIEQPKHNYICFEMDMYSYLHQYTCASIVPGSSTCRYVVDLFTCMDSALKLQGVTCHSSSIINAIQSQPSMMYMGSVKSCANYTDHPTPCVGLTLTSDYFTKCSQIVTGIPSTQPERRCSAWEDAVKCVQKNLYTAGKYCSYKTTTDTLTSYPQLLSSLSGFKPEQCAQGSNSSNSCQEENLYNLVMTKCKPSNMICGQLITVRDCVQQEFSRRSVYCSQTEIEQKVKTLVPAEVLECNEKYSVTLDSKRLVVNENGQKFHVCFSGWDDEDVAVACRQFGYAHGEKYSEYSSRNEILPYTFNCSGNEKTLTECPKNYGMKCSSQQIAVAACYNDGVEFSLEDGYNRNSGRLAVTVNGMKGYVCSDRYMGRQEALSLCVSKGYMDGEVYSGTLRPMSLNSTWGNTISCPISGMNFQACVSENWDSNPSDLNSTVYYCSSYLSVYCYGTLRLNTPYMNNTGYVEMYTKIDGKTTRQSVCGDNVTEEIVGSVCKSLGFDQGGTRLPYDPFRDSGSPNTRVAIGSCSDPNDYTTCDFRTHNYGYGSIDCESGRAVIQCFTNNSVLENTIKQESDGGLRVFRQGLWGGICSTNWTDVEATVYCKSQGYDKGLANKVVLSYEDSQAIWWYNVTCSGNETSLQDCRREQPSVNNTGSCSFSYGAAVLCQNTESIPVLSLRGGKNSRSGRVYVELNGQVGPLCTAYPGNLARVVCKNLGYSDGEDYSDQLQLPTSSGAWRTDLYCRGSERVIEMCQTGSKNFSWITPGGPNEISCGPQNLAQVFCYDKVRLHTGFFNKTGIVQIQSGNDKGEWMAFCPDHLNDEAMDVVCRELNLSSKGHRSPYSYCTYNVYSQYNYSCDGTEQSLMECRKEKLSTYPYCRTPVAVTCQDGYNPSDEIKNATISASGMVMVATKGERAAVCDYGWSQAETNVLCRSMGALGGLKKFGSVDSRVPVLPNLKCSGNETNLAGCSWTNISCSSPVFVRCYTSDDNFKLSIQGGGASGPLLLSKSNQVAHLCDSGYFSYLDAAVVCRHLGFTDGETLSFDNSQLSGSAWQIEFNCPKHETTDLMTCLNGQWSYQTWTSTNYSRCKYSLAAVSCRGSGSKENYTTVNSDCKWPIYRENVMDMCGDVITNISSEIKMNNTAGCSYLPALVRCLSNRLLSVGKICAELDVLSVLRQNRDDVMNITGGLNTDKCDGMVWQPSSACTSLPILAKVLPQCYTRPANFVTDPAEIQNLCSQGAGILTCLTEKLKSSGFVCNVETISKALESNPEFVKENLMFDLSKCDDQNGKNSTTGTTNSTLPGNNSTAMPSSFLRCSNYSYFQAVLVDCSDVINNISAEVKAGQTSACFNFPNLVRCLSSSMIKKSIICTETDVFSVLRQNRSDIMQITGGLNTDKCDGMVWQPSSACTSLPVLSSVLPQCFTRPSSPVTDPVEIQKYCSQGESLMSCMGDKLKPLGYSCSVETISKTMSDNTQFFQQVLMFDIGQCLITKSSNSTPDMGTNSTTNNGSISTGKIAPSSISRCSNFSYFSTATGDCSDIINNITTEVKVSETSACSFFPSLVQCLSSSMVKKSIICAETDVFSVLRQNRDDIINITGGLNTDKCDGMVWQQSSACTSLPVLAAILPQCYTRPDNFVTDTAEIQKLCGATAKLPTCLVENLSGLGYSCTEQMIFGLISQNPPSIAQLLYFDVSKCVSS